MPRAVRELLQNGHNGYDEPDRMPKNISITNLDLIMYAVAIIGHFVDLAVDLNVAVRYYLAKEMEAFGWTLAFILFPAFVNTAVSIRMYAQDKQQDSVTNEVTRRHWLRIFILVLQMAPILRFTDALIPRPQKTEHHKGKRNKMKQLMQQVYSKNFNTDMGHIERGNTLMIGVLEDATPVDRPNKLNQSQGNPGSKASLEDEAAYADNKGKIYTVFSVALFNRYAIKSRRAERAKDPASQRLYYSFMLKEDSDAALLRIFECFLEAAPQLVLQTAIMFRGQEQFTLHQSLSMTSSLIGMGWCLAAYQRAVRFAQEDKDNVTWLGSAMQTAWHYFLTLSRVMSISIIAFLFPYWTILGCSIHILVMTTWIQFFERPLFCAQTRIAEISFSFALGAVYLFTYILSVEGRTRYRYTIYYTICFIENITCGVIWFLYAKDDLRFSNVFYVVLTFTFVPYVLGLVVMVLYYSFLHPTLRKGQHSDNHVTVSCKVNDQTFEIS